MMKGGVFKVGTVRFTDDTFETLHDVYVSIADGFVIVAESEDDTSPTWYSASAVLCMEDVEADSIEQRSNKMRVSYW